MDRIAALAVVTALGLALSACGSAAGSPAPAAAAEGSAPAQSSVASDASSGATQTSTTTQTSPPAQNTSAATGTTATTGNSQSAGSTSTTRAATVTNVTINWIPPTENTDGTPLTNLAGFHIHYGTTSHKYTQTISVSNPGIVRYVVENLTAGKYYFAVGAVNSAGTESPLSSEISATVN